MALNFAFKVYVCFDTFDGLVYETYFRNSWNEVTELLLSFKFKPLLVSIVDFRK